MSESNPWIECTASVALYGRGERATEAEVARTDQLFCELMGRVSVMAQGCDDAYAPASGEMKPRRRRVGFDPPPVLPPSPRSR